MTACEDCSREYRPWFTDNHLWNSITSGDQHATADPGGQLCLGCFTTLAVDVPMWRLIPEWSGRAPLMDFPARGGSHAHE
jgi:hypothetical protein